MSDRIQKGGHGYSADPDEDGNVYIGVMLDPVRAQFIERMLEVPICTACGREEAHCETDPCTAAALEIAAAKNKYLEQIIDLFYDQWRYGGIDLNANYEFSEGDDNGCYVAAWLWVDFEGSELDKFAGEAGEEESEP